MPLATNGFTTIMIRNLTDSTGMITFTAEFVRVPVADKSLIILGEEHDHIEDKDFLVLTDIFPTAWVGVTWSGFEAGDTVAIFGAGPVGLLAAYSALLRGASRVYVVDHVEERLEAAASIGAIPINFIKGEPSAQILAREPDGVQRTVDCVGEECLNGKLKHEQSFVVTQAIKCTSVGGGVGVIGVHFALPTSNGVKRGNTISPTMDFPMTLFWEKNLTLRGGTVDSKLFVEPLLELVKNGRAKPGFVFSSTIDIEQAPTAYRRFDDKLESKVMIKFPGNIKENGHVAAETSENGGLANGANLHGQVHEQPSLLHIRTDKY
jgi:threonine dehydrogenase-like Zn-dependent dehydrogenase